MSVYFRTGQNSGASVPWWFYFLFVLPVQVCWFAAVILFRGAVFVVRLLAEGVAYLVAYRRQRQQQQPVG